MHWTARLLLLTGLCALPPLLRGAEASPKLAAFEKAAAAGVRDPSIDLFPLIDALEGRDIPGALAVLNRLPLQSTMGPDVLRLRLVTRWAAHDPAAAMPYAQGRPKGLIHQMLQNAVAKTWVKSDIDAAKTWALSVAPDDDNYGAVRQVIEALIARDPVSAARLAETTKPVASTARPRSTEPDRWWRMTFHEWARRSPKEAVAFAGRLPKSERRSYALSTVLREWLAQDAAAAWAWLRASPELSDFIKNRHFFDEYARHDPAGAADAVVSLEEPLQSVAARQVGWALAVKDLQSALALARRLPDTDARQVVLGRVAERLLSTGRPFEAAEFTLKMPPSATRDNLCRLIAIKQADDDPRAAIEWVEKLPAGKGRNEARYWAMKGWSEKEAAPAADYLLTIPVADWISYPEFDLARAFARRDPLAALAWVKKLPPRGNEKSLIGVVVQEWARANPHAARKFALEERDGERRDYFLAQVARGLKSKNPAEALRLAEQLPVGKLREETLAELRRPAPSPR